MKPLSAKPKIRTRMFSKYQGATKMVASAVRNAVPRNDRDEITATGIWAHTIFGFRAGRFASISRSFSSASFDVSAGAPFLWMPETTVRRHSP